MKAASSTVGSSSKGFSITHTTSTDGSNFSLLFHIAVPFFLGGFGTCFTGIILYEVQNWAVFRTVNEILILLPALQGLKGNLNMTLASRMSTHSHMGHMNRWDELKSLAIANIALNQILSTTIGLLASTVAIVINAFLEYTMFELDYALLVMVAGLLTCSVASMFIDCFMVFVIYGSQKYKIDPDDVATPLASSLGDICSLSLYAYLSKVLFEVNPRHGDKTIFIVACFTVIIVYVLLLPIWLSIVKNNVHTCDVLYKGSHWYPLISGMFVCTICGLILEGVLRGYSGVALYHPIICGGSGNLVSIQCSKLATYVHRHTKQGSLPENEKVCMYPCAIFLQRPTYETTRILMLIAIPGNIIFFLTTSHLAKDSPPVTATFLILFVAAAELNVFILHYLAYVITYALWVRYVDPDNATIPYLTSIGDVVGATLNSLLFVSLAIGKRHHEENEFQYGTNMTAVIT